MRVNIAVKTNEHHTFHALSSWELIVDTPAMRGKTDNALFSDVKSAFLKS